MNHVFEILYAIPKEYNSNINRKNKNYQEEESYYTITIIKS